MGFLDKIFGKKEQMPEGKRAIGVEELKAEVEKIFEQEKKEFGKECLSKFAKIKETIHSAEDSTKNIEGLDFEQEGENKYFRKIVQSSKESFSGKMQTLLEKTRPPERKSFEQNFAYCQNSAREFQQDIMSFRKNIAYTGLLAKKEMNELGKTIEELEKQLIELFELSKSSKTAQMQRVLEIIGGIRGKERQVAEKENEIKDREKEIQELDAEKSGVLKDADGLKNGEAFQEFEKNEKSKEKLLGEKKDLREKAANLLMPLEKQLRKMQTLSSNKEWILEKEQERMLSSYLEDSFNALRQDPKGEILKQCLQEMENAINKGKISFKDEKEKNRKIQAIEELKNFDFFSTFFWRLNEIDKELPKVHEALEKSTLFRQINGLKAREESIEREAVQKTNELSAVKTIKETQKMKIREEIIKLQEKAKEILGQEIEVKSQP
ncbi:MAG: hypothetical protein Q7R70_03185 [Candidatus Diapherotrites archaeon]|nr:hypothetical protein [Candidatus Diapherotrites archaeon]